MFLKPIQGSPLKRCLSDSFSPNRTDLSDTAKRIAFLQAPEEDLFGDDSLNTRPPQQFNNAPGRKRVYAEAFPSSSKETKKGEKKPKIESRRVLPAKGESDIKTLRDAVLLRNFYRKKQAETSKTDQVIARALFDDQIEAAKTYSSRFSS